jgi:hypothetical protein
VCELGFLVSYVIRIYRKAENEPRLLVGTTQKIGQEDKMAFSTVDELWSILNSVRKEPLKQTNSSPKREPDGDGV